MSEEATARVRLSFDAKGGVNGSVYVHDGDQADDLAAAVDVALGALARLKEAGQSPRLVTDEQHED